MTGAEPVIETLFFLTWDDGRSPKTWFYQNMMTLLARKCRTTVLHIRPSHQAVTTYRGTLWSRSVPHTCNREESVEISVELQTTSTAFRNRDSYVLSLHLYIRKGVSLPPCRRQGGEEYSSYSFLTSALDEVSGQRHALAVFYPRERIRCPLYRRLGGPQSWSGHRD
jgi:hypothetical protein